MAPDANLAAFDPAAALIAAVLGYLLGSIPTGMIITRALGLGDLRTIGSGNIGATNVLRTGSKWAALGTLLGDAGKGALAVLLGGLLGPVPGLVAGGAAFLGHLFPVWLRFKGGKGVATFFGIVLALHWPVGLLALATWLAVALVSGFSSLAALVAVVAVPGAFATLGLAGFLPLALFLAVLVYARHADNIRRLLRGQESKISLRKAR